MDLIAGLIHGVLRARNPDTAQVWTARIPLACTPMQSAVDELVPGQPVTGVMHA